jgi:hypothetical protein
LGGVGVWWGPRLLGEELENNGGDVEEELVELMML